MIAQVSPVNMLPTLHLRSPIPLNDMTQYLRNRIHPTQEVEVGVGVGLGGVEGWGRWGSSLTVKVTPSNSRLKQDFCQPRQQLRQQPHLYNTVETIVLLLSPVAAELFICRDGALYELVLLAPLTILVRCRHHQILWHLRVPRGHTHVSRTPRWRYDHTSKTNRFRSHGSFKGFSPYLLTMKNLPTRYSPSCVFET